MITEGIDFSFVEKADSDFYSIKILTGDWQGIVFTFGKVSISEDTKTDTATLSYDYRIEESPSFSEEDLLNSDSFRNFLGDILVTILENNEAHIGPKPDGAKPTDHNT